MNFKNISLLAALVIVGFVGTVVHGYEVELGLQMELKYKGAELAARIGELRSLEKCLDAYKKLEESVSIHCDAVKRENRKKRLSQDSFEVCVYNQDLLDSIDGLDVKIMELENIISTLKPFGPRVEYNPDYE